MARATYDVTASLRCVERSIELMGLVAGMQAVAYPCRAPRRQCSSVFAGAWLKCAEHCRHAEHCGRRYMSRELVAKIPNKLLLLLR
jgi:hypothetical protein